MQGSSRTKTQEKEVNSNLVESSNDIKEKKNQIRDHLLYLLVCPPGIPRGWSFEIPDIG